MTDTDALRELLEKNTLRGPFKAFRSTIEPDRSYVGNDYVAFFATEIGASGWHDAEMVAECLNALPGLLDTITTQAARNAKLEAEVGRLRNALEGVVDDEPCWYDHHGYCQTHFITAPCEMAIARTALTESAK